MSYHIYPEDGGSSYVPQRYLKPYAPLSINVKILIVYQKFNKHHGELMSP
jgi:hypothetical protein